MLLPVASVELSLDYSDNVVQETRIWDMLELLLYGVLRGPGLRVGGLPLRHMQCLDLSANHIRRRRRLAANQRLLGGDTCRAVK